MICFLDVDGVLVDFNKSATAIIGAKNPPVKYYWQADYPNGYEHVNNGCSVDFWLNLEWMCDGKEILKLVESFFGDNVFLLTCPMSNPGSWTGKYLWVEKHLPQYKEKIIITSASKSVFTLNMGKVAWPSVSVMLIDDKEENKDDFVSAGGDAILVPRPWNRLSQFQTVVYLEKELIKRF